VIEQSLYFALGFFLATLLALAVLPAFWRRAYRLTRREIEATLPLSPREIAAERDQLRAKFAVERYQLEQQIADIRNKRFDDMKVTGQKAITIAERDDTIQSKIEDITALTQARAEQDELLNITNTSLEEARTNLAQQAHEFQLLSETYRQTQGELEASTHLAAQRADEISALKSNMAAQFKRVEELAESLRQFKELTKKNAEEAKGFERSLRDSEKDRAILTRQLEASTELASKREVIISERDGKLIALQEKLTALTTLAKQLDASNKEEARKVANTESMLRAREETITRTREDSALTARDLTKTIDKIRADRQKLQTDLSEARAKASLLQRELSSLKRMSSATDLRRASLKDNPKENSMD
jgi:DNA repair exonuclease SbcCD ATPase subunit